MGPRRLVPTALALTLIACTTVLAIGASTQQPLRWRDIRGTNYIPASSLSDNNIEMWLPRAAALGTFSAALVDAELAAIARCGVNSIRVFGSFYAFAASPADYERDLRALLDGCRRHRLRVTFIVWDGFGRDGLAAAVARAPCAPGPEIRADVARARAALRRANPTLPTNMGGCWFSSPGRAYHAAHPSPVTWDPPLAEAADRYLDRIARVFGGSYGDVFHAYDLYNEPENLYLVPGMTYRTLVRISADLCEYTVARLARHHPRPAVTVGTAFITTCWDLDRELRGRGMAPFDYLSYHDYDHPSGILPRAAFARYHGIVAGRDVVCSEFHQAARQGGLWAALQALDQMKLGGQIWDLLRDRVFVVEFPELAPVMGDRSRCWFHESGLIRSAADPEQSTGFRFDPIDPVKCAAFKAWATHGGLPPFAPPEVNVTPISDPRRGPTRYRITVRGLAHQPAWLLVAPPDPACVRLPGLGAAAFDVRTRMLPLGTLAPTAVPGLGEWSHEIAPMAHPIQGVCLQALVGNDYDPLRWQNSCVTALSPIVPVKL